MPCKPCNDKLEIVNATVTRTVPNTLGSVVTVNAATNSNLNTEIANPVNHCPTNKITHIGKVNDDIVVTMDDCTFYKAKLNKLNIASFSTINSVMSGIAVKDNSLVITLHNQITGEESTKTVQLVKATTKEFGTVRFATEEEVLLGTSSTVVMSPASTAELTKHIVSDTSNLPKASNTSAGTVKFATSTDIKNSSNNVAVTPADVNGIITNKITEFSKAGITIYGNDGKTVLGKLISGE